MKLLLLLLLVIHLTEANELYIGMGDFAPSKNEAQICTAVKLDEDLTYHLKKFRPVLNNDVHHLTIGACDEAGSMEKHWNCGSSTTAEPGLPSEWFCKDRISTLYGWTYGTHSMTLPDDHAYEVGKDTKYKYLYMNIHYRFAVNGTDNHLQTPGVYVTYDIKPKSNAITESFALIYGGRAIFPPHQQVSIDIFKPMDVEIHPLFVQLHTHDLGIKVSAYVVKKRPPGSNEDVWIRLGQRGPTVQDILPVENDVVIEKGDSIAGRCTYFNNRTEYATMGSTMRDEMCEVVIIYWVKEGENRDSLGMSNEILKPWEAIGLNNIPLDA